MKACEVVVPGSASNLGAGFDCVGVAVSPSLRARFTAGGDRVSIVRRGTLSGLQSADGDDLIWRGFAAAAKARAVAVPSGVSIEVDSEIPVGRGLGSSAAAVVAGILAANHLLSLGLGTPEQLEIAVSIEGHPDNAAPAIYGGGVLSVPVGPAAFYSAALAIHSSLRFIFAVPTFATHTEEARAVLPNTVAFGTAVVAAAKSAALVMGLASGDGTLLEAALDDVLHVPPRKGLILAYDEVVAAARAAGAFGATLSGSGSSIVAIARAEKADRVGQSMSSAWAQAGEQCDTFVSVAAQGGARCTGLQETNPRGA